MRYKIFIAETGEPVAFVETVRVAVRVVEYDARELAILDTETDRILS